LVDYVTKPKNELYNATSQKTGFAIRQSCLLGICEAQNFRPPSLGLGQSSALLNAVLSPYNSFKIPIAYTHHIGLRSPIAKAACTAIAARMAAAVYATAAKFGKVVKIRFLHFAPIDNSKFDCFSCGVYKLVLLTSKG
jgi:hypothetical protein